MQVSQRFAVNQWLSDYPDNMAYDEILGLMQNDAYTWSHPLINPWCIVEDCTLSQIADFIEDTRAAFERSLTEIKEGA
jgi:hypothetical protein